MSLSLMSLGFSILGEAESETSKFLTFLSLKAMDTSLAHGQSSAQPSCTRPDEIASLITSSSHPER